VICPGCRRENPAGFQFCGFCGAPLPEAAPAATGEERKIVSVLFCDLVGFTASSERADPEDVRARLRPYHARVRTEIERFGGTVEKFVGDAVMAVFGAPAAHEDDAERAVRAGLRVLQAIDELNSASPELDLRVRIGINTGETVVDRGARPELGEGIVAGDAVNAAARLQAAAPVGGVAVGELTYEQTRRVFEYEQLEPVQAKGKTEPLGAWRPLASRAAFGSDVTRTHGGLFVGREGELDRLRQALEDTLQNRGGRLVMIVGEPGIGKSRLLAEFQSHVETLRPAVTWRQGRCLPYGDGIAFWALGEIVKAHAGIYESDSTQAATDKLDAVLPELEERPWLRSRLLPLLGIDAGQGVSREESFTAWGRFLETIRPEGAVIVFEDLHWADLALLDFLSHLTEGIARTRQLVVCTARPELYDRRAEWGDGGRSSQIIALEPLSDAQTAVLVSSLVEHIPAKETRRLILDRAEGNPLYAEEIVRLLADQDLLAAQPGEVPVPDSLNALIAARLDTLSTERKSLLQDGAVLGNIFWPAALVVMGPRGPDEVEAALRELGRKEFVRPSDGQLMQGELDYAFWHALIRDVAYSQISRAQRVDRHRLAAEWIEGRAGERIGDLADVISHHYLAALDLSRALGLEAPELEAGAIRYLALAAERTLSLDVSSAEASLAKALDLAPVDHPDRPMLLERWGEAAEQLGRLREATVAVEEATGLYRARGDLVSAGRALTALSHMLARAGDPRREQLLQEALGLLDTEPPGPELIAAYTQLAAREYVESAYRLAISAADKALALARELGLDPPARALGFRGGSRACLGDPRGIEDMRHALELAVAQGKGRDAAVIYNNLAIELLPYEGPIAALAACRDAIEFSTRRGITEFALSTAGMRADHLLELGRIDEALAQAADSATRAAASGAVPELIESRAVELGIRAERGEYEQARRDADELIAVARAGGEPQQLIAGLAIGALVHVLDRERSRALLVELEQTPQVREDHNYVIHLPALVRCALAAGDRALAARLVEGVPSRTPLHEYSLKACRPQLEEAGGDHAAAAVGYAETVDRWWAFDRVPERAYALLGLGRCMLALGDPGAEQPLGQAADLFSSMSYRPALAETQALLEQTTAPAS
jgi:class 3 adenylate cyclase/tetratricopeptide (TPR) repeat protein